MIFLIGLLAGIFGGLVGLGGGIVMIPLLTLLHKLSQRQAHATSLVAVVFTGLAGTITYASKASVDFFAAFILAAAAIPMARLGALYCHALAEHHLKRSLGGLMVFVSLLLLLKPYLLPHAVPLTGWPKILTLLATGLFTGFISGMMGVGGGGIMSAAMVIFAGMSQYAAQGSALLAMIPTGGLGAYTHWKLGNVEERLVPGLVGGVLLGTFLGGSLALIMPESQLRTVFAVVIIGMGVHYIRTPGPICEDA